MSANYNQLHILLEFLEKAIRYRILTDIKGKEYKMPELHMEEDESPLCNYIKENEITINDLIALTLAMIPHLYPTFLSNLMKELFPEGETCDEFGGIKVKNHAGLIPTGETLLFIIVGNDLEARLEASDYFFRNSPLFAGNVVYVEELPIGESKMSGRLIIDAESLDLFTTGTIVKPKMGTNFPAQLIETQLEWSNLVLQSKTLSQIHEIQSWLLHHDLVMNEWGMKRKVKPGFRIMFYGPPGTGKTLTAGLLGKYTGRDVYRIDLSLIVSKYIGETEKNLSRLFDKAANKDWILFFDEADSVFGKRTSVRDAHDKYANQEVSYLLQRIESHPGLVILASNLKNNIDSAFTRRFQSIIEFETPGVNERLKLWKDNLPEMVPVEENVSLHQLSRLYNLTGANIVNVVQYACLKTAEQEKLTIGLQDLIEGVKREYIKEGRLM